MSTSVEVIAGDECVCPCHRDPSIHHVVACCADCADCSTRVVTAALPDHQPTRCAGFRWGRLALRVDAGVCLVAGVAVVIAALVAHSTVPTAVAVVLGIVVAAWGIGLWFAPTRSPLRAVLAVVTAVNLVAALALLVVAIVASDGGLRLVSLIAAVVVALFALWDVFALRKTQAR